MSEGKTSESNISTKDFLSSGIIWAVIFILLPVFIWLGTNNWVVTLSTCAKIGAALFVIGLALLTCNIDNLTGAGGLHIRNKKAIRDFVTRQVFSAVSFAKVWITLWGLIYLLPLLFGIPFIL